MCRRGVGTLLTAEPLSDWYWRQRCAPPFFAGLVSGAVLTLAGPGKLQTRAH